MPASAVRRRTTVLLSLLNCAPLTACDASWSLDPGFHDDIDDDGPPVVMRKGTWPPTTGTLNTAWLGNDDLMRLLPPGDETVGRDTDAHILKLNLMTSGGEVNVESVTAVGGDLVLHANGQQYRGEQIIGSRWWLDTEETLYLTISEYSTTAAGNHLYQFKHHSTDGEIHAPVCVSADVLGSPWAYMVQGVRIDGGANMIPEHGPLLMACTNGALGKAIDWGFSPWDENSDPDLLLWETGVRAIRADYCGNGIAYTQTGTPIHLSNPSAGLSFLASAGATEAVFGPDGALCLTSPRVIASPMDLPCALSKCDDVGGAPALITTPYHTWTKIQPSLPDTF